MLLRRLFIIILVLCLLSSPVFAGDESEIVRLCENGNKIVELEAKTYLISNSFELPSDIELRGQEGTIFKFADECGIPQNVPMISGKNLKNITITGIQFEGNQDHQTYALKYSNPNHPEQSGKKAYGNQVGTFIYFINCQNIKVTECAFNDNLGDGLRLSGCTNIEFAYNTGQMGGHDAFFALRSSGIRVHHNNIKTLVNSACRLLDVNHARVYNNVISWEGPRDAGPAIQIQHDTGIMEDIEVCGNVIWSSCCPGLWLVGKSSGNEELWLHHNLFMNCGDNRISWVGGIIASGYDNAKIENNVFDSCYRGSVVFFAVNSAWATEADAELTANIFTNARPSQLTGKGGFGVENTISKQDVASSQNCYYNNKGGNVYGCSLSNSDIFVNPKEVGTPSGWTWNGKEWSCPDVVPSEMNVPGDFTPLTDKEIEEADQSATEFDNIFDIFQMDFVEQAGQNDTIILPNGMNTSSSEATGTIEQYNYSNPYTLVNVPSNGLTSVEVSVDGINGIHTLMIGEKQGGSVIYTSCSLWEGEIKHSGDSFYLDGIVNPDKIEITCNTPKGSFKPSMDIEVIEPNKGLFKPIFKYAFVIILICFIYCLYVFRFTF